MPRPSARIGKPPAALPGLRVAAFTGGARAPSARFRVRQYIPALASHGVRVIELAPRLGSYPPVCRWQRPLWGLGTLAQRLPQIAAGRAAEVTLLHREMVSTLYTLEGLTRRPRVIDVDDAIHLFRHGHAARRLGERSELVIVGNPWLAEAWQRWNQRVEILPTAVDTQHYRVTALPERPVVGWIGSAGNLRYLEDIAPALAEVARRFPDALFAVCCERAPDLGGLPFRFVPWSAEAEAEFLSSLTIGLMPLDDGPWERGKCSFKMLQYMAAARPCVVSPVGMNRDVLAQAEVGLAARTHAEWVAALSSLLSDRRGAEALGGAGRRLVEMRYSLAVLAPRLAQILRKVAR